MQEDPIWVDFLILLEAFKKVTKRVLQNRPLSTKQEKIQEYILKLCESYNNLTLYSKKHNQTCTVELLSAINARLQKCRVDLLKCGFKLDYTFEFSESQPLLSYPIFSDSDSDFEDASSDITYLDKTTSTPENLNFYALQENKLHKVTSTPNLESSTVKTLFDHKFLNLPIIITNNSTTMATAESKRTFINMCSSMIRLNYNGDPLGLDSFIDKITLIEDLTDENLMPTLVRFIISKLEGKARESLPDSVTSLDVIKQSLKDRIKPDNSKVVAGKISSVKVVDGNYSEFSKQVEELADALERSLVVEGVTRSKAHEMAVEQTVSTCRSNAKSDLVKSILASTKFNDPKDVVAKLVIEQANEVTEKSVLRLNSMPNNNSQWSGNYVRQNSFFNPNRHSYNNNNFHFNRGNNFRNGRGFNHNNFSRFRQNNNNYRNFQPQNSNYNNNRNANNNQFNNNRQFQNTNNRFQRTDNTYQVRTLNAEGHQGVDSEIEKS